MDEYRVETTVAEDGTLTLKALPFQAGERVEVTVVAASQLTAQDDRYPLRGSVYHYDRPFDPAVPEDDWEANR